MLELFIPFLTKAFSKVETNVSKQKYFFYVQLSVVSVLRQIVSKNKKKLQEFSRNTNTFRSVLTASSFSCFLEEYRISAISPDDNSLMTVLHLSDSTTFG